MSPSLFRAITFGCAFVAIALLERLLPMFTERRELKHDIRNLALGTLNTGILIGVFSALWVSVMDGSTAAQFGLLHRLHLPPLWHLLAAVLLFDCWQYWWHRMSHRISFFWRFHAVHHADPLMNASTAIRFHSGEIVLSAIARLAILPLIGVQPGHLLLYESLLLPVILFQHSNTRLSNEADRLLRSLITTPWMHWVHHSRLQTETDSNYSSFLSIWDRLFGTFQLNPNPENIVFGLDDFDDKESLTLGGMLMAPVRHRFRNASSNNSDHSDTTEH